MTEKKPLLVLSPHTDDGELAAGGTIARFSEESWEVYYVAFSSRDKSLPPTAPDDQLQRECLAATKLLGIPKANVIFLKNETRSFPSQRQSILDQMIELRDRFSPQLVLVPSAYDTHQDHRTVFEESLRAFKKSSSIWGFEHPWNNLSFTTDIFVALDENHVERKAEALAKYVSQKTRSYFKRDFILAWARMRGTQVGIDHAEAFELVRMIVT